MATTLTAVKLDALLEQALKGRKYTPLTWDMLLSLCGEWIFRYRHDNEMDVDAVTTTRAVKQVLNTGTCDFGDSFTERVHEAMSYTPSPFDGRGCDYDLP
jgi:hypothetical protein